MIFRDSASLSRQERFKRWLARADGAKAGERGHDRMFHVACVGARFGLTESELHDLLEPWNQERCQPAWSRSQLSHKIRSALRIAERPSGATGAVSAEPTWPEVDEERQRKAALDGPGLAELWELSPYRLHASGCTEEIVDALFPGDPLLCAGVTSFCFDTRPRSQWRGQFERWQLIVPSPMSAVTGATQGGNESKHTLSNTGPRRFLVVEFDQGVTDLQSALLSHLSQFGPLVMAVQSGGKSLHGWFNCSGHAEESLLKFMRYAVSLGADRATWLRSQFVRTPDARRENGNRQSVIYFNPAML